MAEKLVPVTPSQMDQAGSDFLGPNPTITDYEYMQTLNGYMKDVRYAPLARRWAHEISQALKRRSKSPSQTPTSI